MSALENILVVGLGLGTVIAIIVFVIVLFLIVPFVLMVCWNFVMSGLFGLPELNIWSAIALWIVFSLLFGGVRYSSSSS